MNIHFIRGDLFTSDRPYVHCISADCALGAGIARQIELRFHVKELLLKKQYAIVDYFKRYGGFAVRTNNIINLVTKEHYYDKPTYQTLRQSLESLKKICTEYKISEVAMPAIGCGLDKLNFTIVQTILSDVFSDTDLDITVYLR